MTDKNSVYGASRIDLNLITTLTKSLLITRDKRLSRKNIYYKCVCVYNYYNNKQKISLSTNA